MKNSVEDVAFMEKMAASASYLEYVEIVNTSVNEEADWKRGKHLVYLCNEVQKFIETDTGHAYDIMVINIPPQHGKALGDNTPVLTTKGWKKHGDLKVGEFVYGVNGQPKRITHVQQSYQHDCMRLILDSGDEFICAKEHEWVVECNRDRKIKLKRVGRETEVLETQNIFKGYHAKSPAIKVANQLENQDAKLHIEPYLLGLWLGDGSSRTISITSHIDDYEEITQRLINKGHIVSVRNDSGNNKLICVGITTGAKSSNYFLNGLKKYSLIRNKHIPKEYYNASYNQRLELLKGMMDTDGCVTKDGKTCEYCGINKTLVEEVYSLVRSLGFKCSLLEGDATLNGKFISKKYRVQFTPHKGQPVFNLKRKQDRINNKIPKDRGDKLLYFIKSVENCGRHSVKCITVEGGIYLVGKGLVPTHNSMSITEALPSWFLGKYPERSVIAVAYGDDLAQRFGRRNKSKIEEFGKRIFEIELSKEKNANDDFEIERHKGRMISKGIMSGVTGNPGHLVLIDDPVKTKEEAYSEAYREKVWGEWQNSIKTRLAAGAKVVLIMTRWHEDDLAGRVIDSEENVIHINIPCEAEEDDPLGRQPGDALFPEIGKDKAWKDAFKQSYINSEGMDTWNSLYQGRPSAQKGNIFQRDWWKLYTELPELYSMILSVDATFKDKATSDKVAMTIWGKSGPNVYLVDLLNKQMGFVDTVSAIKTFKSKYPKITMILIEDKANGSAIIDTLKREIMGVVAVNPLGSKESRARAVTAFVEAGNVWLPKNESYTEEFISQHAAFPKGKFDDLVDSTSQALIRFKDYVANAPMQKKKKDFFETEKPKDAIRFSVPKKFFKF